MKTYDAAYIWKVFVEKFPELKNDVVKFRKPVNKEYINSIVLLRDHKEALVFTISQDGGYILKKL